MVVSPTPPTNNSSENPRYDETVTLTKSQLRAILDSVSNSRGSSGERPRHHSSPTLENDQTSAKDVNPNYPDSVSSLAKSDTRPCTSIPDVPLFLHERSFASPILRNSSRVEQKRIQWERERAEMQEWNPWGRPGAGAPLRTHYNSPSRPYTQDLNLKITGQNQSMQQQLPSPLMSARTPDESWISPSRNFTRGHGFAMDAGTNSQQQEKRLRALEYQREIERQVEEKKQRQKEEKDKLMQYELEQERKLAEERVQIQAEFVAEQEKQKQKEEQKQKKNDILLQAVADAKKEAEAIKRMRKLKKLNINAQNNNEEKNSSQHTPKEVIREVEFLPSQVIPVEHVSHHQSYSPSNSSQKEFSTQASLESSDDSNHSGYIENRVLTPSKMRRMRHDSSSPSRLKNFGTQTDSYLLIGTWVNDESATPSENMENSTTSQQTFTKRVQYSQPTKALATHSEPKHKSDSKLYKRKKLQELKKQHWENDAVMNLSASVMPTPRNSLSAPRVASNLPNSYSPSHNLPYDPELAQQVRIPSRPGSPPVPALQKKLGMVPPSPRLLEFTSPYNARPPPFEKGRSSPPVPALRKKVDSSPSRPQIKAISSEHLPALTFPLDQKQKLTSLPLRFNNNFNNTNGHSSASSSSSSAGSVKSGVSLRRRWHSQENFEPDSLYNDDGSQQSRRINRKKWDTQKETFDHLHISSSLEDKSPNVPTTPPQNPLMTTPTLMQGRILQRLSDLRQGLTQKNKEFENLLQNTAQYS